MVGRNEVEIRAIMFTDMVGSTRLRAELGESRADAVHRLHDELVGSAVATHRGQVVRWTGDGVKAAFTSASAAVQAALDIQRAVAAHNRRTDGVAPFQVRIGISVGEVTEAGGDLHGLVVIEAARLEPLAEPGTILATDLVARIAVRSEQAAFEKVGERELKGLPAAVPVVQVVDRRAAMGPVPLPRWLAPDRRFPLVGRTSELGAGVARWRAAVDGRRSALLISGQPGQGKSRLAAHLAERAHAEGALVLAGLCDSEIQVPYEPFAQALREARAEDRALAAAIDAGTGPLGPLFPGHRTARPDELGGPERLELFDAVAATLESLSSVHPVLVVLEDLHWATGPTVQLLRHLLRRVEPARLLVVGTFRADDVDPAHPLRNLLAETRTDSEVEQLVLDALTEADVADMALARLPGATAATVADFARRLCQESAGSPFFVCELLHHLETTGELTRLLDEGGGRQLPVPDTVRDVVEQRLARFPGSAQDVLGMAAVIGLGFDLDLLAGVLDRPADEVLALLEEVERAALVLETGAGTFAFRHAIVRNTLLERSSATRRALAHRRVATTIEALGRHAFDDLAHHWLAAGVEDAAYVNLERAARRDLEALAYESAADRYRQVLDHVRRTGAGPGAEARAWLGNVLARRALGQRGYLADVVEVGRLAHQAADPDLMIEVALASVWPNNFFVTAGRTEGQLVELCERALRAVPTTDVRRINLLATLAVHLLFDNDTDRLEGLLAEAEGLARERDDPRLVGIVLVARCLSLWRPDRVDRRAEAVEEMSRMAARSGDAELACFAGYSAAALAAELADVAEARRLLAALDEPLQATHDYYFGFMAERLAISLDALTGAPGVQARIDGLAERYAHSHADVAGTWLVQTGGLARQRGSLGDLADAMASIIESSVVAPNWAPAYGSALFATGDRSGAAEVLDAFKWPPIDFFWLVTLQITADLAIDLARADVADQLHEALLPYRGRLGVTGMGSSCFGLVSTTLGELAVVGGRPREAEILLAEAVEQADTIGSVYDAARARRVLAAVPTADGSPRPDAARLRAEAADLARRHGFDGELRALAGTDGG